MHGDGVVRMPAARAGERPSPLAANSAPSISVRRDACHCISARAVAEGANGGSNAIRFRFCAIYHRAAALRGPAFSAHSWLYCRTQYRLSGSPDVSRSRRISRGESRAKRRPFGWARGRERCEEKGTNCNGSSDRIGPAAGPGADRLLAAAGLLAAAMVVAAPALAQQPKPRQTGGAESRRPPSRPRQRQRRRTGAAAQAAAAPPQLMYSPWMKVCGKGPETNNKQVCVAHQGRPPGKRHAGRASSSCSSRKASPKCCASRFRSACNCSTAPA